MRQYYQLQERKKTQMFKLRPKLAWRQRKGQKVRYNPQIHR